MNNKSYRLLDNLKGTYGVPDSSELPAITKDKARFDPGIPFESYFRNLLINLWT